MSPGAINCDLLTQKGDNIAVIFSLLEEEPIGVEDFYVRYHTVQLLSCLVNTGVYKIEEAILKSPMGAIRVLDLLKDREAIRNEALLLLEALTKHSIEIQKIAAFEVRGYL